MNRFRELRLSKGLTQLELQFQFNERFDKKYTTAALSQFENGKRVPETSALIDFADFYGVSLDYLLGRDAPKPEIPKLVEQVKVSNPDEVDLVRSYRRLNSDGRHTLKSVLKSLVASNSKKMVVSRAPSTV